MSVSDLELARLSDLAVEHLIDALEPEEVRELQELRRRHPEFDLGELERATAALQLAAMMPLDPLPERVRIRLATAAAGFFGSRWSTAAGEPSNDAPTRRPSLVRRRPDLGWWVAAASLSGALLVWISRPSPTTIAQLPRADQAVIAQPPEATVPSPVPANASGMANGDAQHELRSAEAPRSLPVAVEPMDAAAAREQMLASSRFVVHRSWRAGNDSAGRAVTGDVVWDPRTQRGYMRFVGLRRNNPNVEQYQLWIFDARRDERYPVDGGVFDITRDTGSEVIAIKANLKVNVPLMFAITIERPGGVVVSDRTRIAALANSG